MNDGEWCDFCGEKHVVCCMESISFNAYQDAKPPKLYWGAHCEHCNTALDDGNWHEYDTMWKIADRHTSASLTPIILGL